MKLGQTGTGSGRGKHPDSASMLHVAPAQLPCLQGMDVGPGCTWAHLPPQLVPHRGHMSQFYNRQAAEHISPIISGRSRTNSVHHGCLCLMWDGLPGTLTPSTPPLQLFPSGLQATPLLSAPHPLARKSTAFSEPLTFLRGIALCLHMKYRV